MKNQWPFWLFLVGIVVVIIISMNYQGGERMVPLGEVFTEQGQQGLDFEYVSESEVPQDAMQKTEDPKVDPEPVKEAAEQTTAPVKKVEQKQVEVKKESIAETGTSAVHTYSIQILSSKDHDAVLKALKKAQDRRLTNAYVKSVDLAEKGTWHRLYAGGYATKEKAQQALSKINKEQYPGAFIVKTGK